MIYIFGEWRLERVTMLLLIGHNVHLYIRYFSASHPGLAFLLIACTLGLKPGAIQKPGAIDIQSCQACVLLDWLTTCFTVAIHILSPQINKPNTFEIDISYEYDCNPVIFICIQNVTIASYNSYIQ